MMGVSAMRFVGLAALLVMVASEESHHDGPEHNGAPGQPGYGRDSIRGGNEPHGRQEEGHHHQAEMCSSTDSQNALEASSTFVECTDIQYSDFVTLVQADISLIEGAALCFASAVSEMEGHNPHSTPAHEGQELSNHLEACVNQITAAEGGATLSTSAASKFLKTMIGDDSKVCSCLSEYVDHMPLCDHWQRFHQFGSRVQAVCDAIPASQNRPAVNGTVPSGQNTTESPTVEHTVPAAEIRAVEEHDGEKDQTVEVVERPSEKTGETNRLPKFPNETPPCPPGQHPNSDDPTKCQSPETEGNEFQEPPYHEQDDHGSRPQGGSGFSFALNIMAIVVLGSMIGIGGVWAWQQFQNRTRQPGVRYMATGLEPDIGTELGPFRPGYN